MLLTLLFLVSMSAVAQDKSPGIRIEAVEGAPSVEVLTGLKSRAASAGEAIASGERVKTSKDATATISYADGSKVVVKPDSEFQIEDQVKGTQWNRLRQGKVRGIIQKVEEAPARPRFLIRSKTAVMGVRGTDFVMALGKGSASIHTLEGAVEVARTETALLGGQGTPVSAGQMVEATSSGISQPRSFDAKEFLKGFESPGGGGAPASGGAATPGSVSAPAAPPAFSAAAPEIPAPSMAPPPRLQPEQQKQVDAAEAKKAEAEKRKIRIAAFRVAPTWLRPPNEEPWRLLAIAWTPSIPIPFLPVEIRGHAGGGFFQNGRINSTFVLHEYHVFVGQTFLKQLIAEFGAGWQLWRSKNERGKSVTLNLGYVFKPNGFFNHVFLGRTLLYPWQREQITIHETRVGVGFVIF